jgi:hypothetical protein
MKTLVLLLEEPSAKAMLQGLLPRVLRDGVQVHFMVFEGKQDLERQLGRKIRDWLIPNSVFLVMRDQDSGDCRVIKENLLRICREAGRSEALVRIACRELESWYFGDLGAVEKGLDLNGIRPFSNKARYREPDQIVNPASELHKITKGSYQKIDGSRKIGPHLDIENNTSRSFQIFLDGIRRLLANVA